MYVVDRSKVLSISLKKAEVDNSFEYKEEEKSLFGRVLVKEGWYRYGSHLRNEELFLIDNKTHRRPRVIISFIDAHQEPDYFYFNTDKEALEFFNKIAVPNNSIK